MASPSIVKSQRIEMRVSAWQKELLQEASALEGVNMSDYILMKMLDAARATISENQTASLNLSQRMQIAEIISAPPATPTEAMLALQTAYGQFADVKVGKK